MIRDAIAAIVAGRTLNEVDASHVMGEIMQGEATPAQVAAFITGLKIRGETPEEIAGLAAAMRGRAVRIDAGAELDTCGTGGDGSQSFNISTAAALVAAGAGVRVAKHGNRAMSSRCGSADVLESLGLNLSLSPLHVEACIRDVGIGFLYAPVFHPAMRYAAGPRQEIGVRTVFNILGPLCNPAGASAQLLGVADSSLVAPMASVLQRLGCRRAMIVHGEDGLDEVTLAGWTEVCELRDNSLRRYALSPADFGLPSVPAQLLSCGSGEENARVLRDVLEGVPGPHRDVVLANSAAALYIAGVSRSLQEGVAVAREVMVSGRAMAKLDELVRMTRSGMEVGA